MTAASLPSGPPPGPSAGPSQGAARALALEVHDALAQAEPVWRALEARAPATCYQRFDYVAAWQAAIGAARGYRPFIVVGRVDGVPALVLPLALTRHGPAVAAGWFGERHFNVNLPLIDRTLLPDPDPPQMEGWLRAAARFGGRVDLYHLRRQPPVWDGLPNPMALPGGVAGADPVPEADLDGGFEAYLERHNRSKKRKRFKNRKRALDRLGDYAFRTLAGGEAAHAALDVLVAQKRRRFAVIGVPDMFEEPGAAAFYHGLVDRAALEIQVLEVGGVIRATFASGIAGRRRSCFLNSMADDETQRMSAGVMALHHVFEESCGRGLDRLDLGVGDAVYKSAWTDRDVALVDTVMPVTPLGRLVAPLVEGAARLRRAAKSSPLVLRVLQRGRRGPARPTGEDDEE